MDQTTFLRRMSGKARLEQAFKLSNFVRELVRKNIRQGRKLTKTQAMQELRQRIYPGGANYAR